MKKKVLSLIVALVMVLTMLPVTGLAADTPPAVNITQISYADGAVSLAWQAQDGVDGYRVYRKTGTGSWTSILSSTTATSYVDDTVTEGKTYSYTIRSFVGKTYSAGYADTAKTITAKASVETQPVTITSISYANGAVSLAWQGQDGVDGYRVYRKTGSGKWSTVLSSTTATSYVDNTVTEGKTYSYTIRSKVGSTWSTGYDATAKTITAKAAVEPQPVTITSISYANGAVSLAWQAQDGVDGYRVYRKTGSGKWTTVLSSTTATSYKDTTVTEGTTYSYTIRSNVGSAWSTGYADTAATITAKAAVDPMPVTITSISYANGAVSLAWQGQDGVDGYRVYRKTGSGKWTIVLSSTTGTSYTDTTVTEGTTYSYTVRSNVGSAWSTGYADTAATITAKPAVEPAPVTITSIDYANGAVSLAWQGQDGVDGYRVYRKTGSGKWTVLLSSTTATSYTDTTVTEGTTYSYTIRSNVGSAWSTGYADTAATITAKAAVDPMPVTITDISYADGAVSLAWQGQDGVDGYRVYRKTGSGKWTSILSSTTETSYTDTTVTEGTTYSYTIRSFVGKTYSTGYDATAKSIKVSPAAPPDVNINMITQSSTGGIKIAWDAADNVDGYRVYKKSGSGSWKTALSNTTDTTFIDTDVTPGVTYYYTVRSVKGGVWSTGYNDTAKSFKAGTPGLWSNGGTINGIDDKTVEKVYIPVSIDGAAVTSIGGYAFRNCSSLTSVIIPEGVTSIGEHAFDNCSSLTTVIIPEGVTSIGAWTFAYCSNLTLVIIPKSVTCISYGAFRNCSSLKSMTIPEGVTCIENDTFSGCSSLTSVTIPSSVTSIGESAFHTCSSLTSVTIPEGVTCIEEDTFRGCSSLTSVTIPSSVMSIGKYAFLKCISLTSVTIPEGVTCIEEDTFSGCSSLTSVTIPSSVTSIGERAFHTCSSLTSVTIPSSVTSIGERAFQLCSGLTSVTIPEGVTSIAYQAFSGCSGLTSVMIPEGVTSIAYQAFSGCSGLTSVTIPEGVTSIGSYAFSGCTGLTSVTIPSGITSIGDGIFQGCSSLTSVMIPEGVTSIGERAFQTCESLTSVTIPSSVKDIGDYAFQNCRGLVSVTISEGVESIGKGAFSNCTALTSITIPSSVKSIGADAFKYCKLTDIKVESGNNSYVSVDNVLFTKDMKTLVKCSVDVTGAYAIPSGVTDISEYAFYNCRQITSLSIPSSVTKIGKYAFEQCRGLTSLIIPKSVTDIGGGAFRKCWNLTSITVDKDNAAYVSTDGVLFTKDKKTIVAFPYGKAVSYSIPSGVTTIGCNAFDGCDKLTSVTIPSSAKSIGNYAFYNCSSLTSVTISNGVTSIDQAAFQGCSSLTSVTIPSSVTSIGQLAFQGCSSLTSVTIPSSARQIDGGVFRDCTSLTSIVIPEGVTVINQLFRNCTALKSVSIPKSVTDIYASSFEGCTALTDVYYAGTHDEWSTININENNNDPLYSATIHYNSAP
ncbi:MAG: leucine-rich repeat protein [Clostridia bacterium]|nr:leucine-rich repeat protein [Clostridia bacterium]